MRPGGRTTVALVAALTVLGGAVLARAQQWQFELTPYFWAAGIDGDLGVRDSPDVSVSADFTDIVKDLDFGAFVTFEARRAPWLLLLDAVYIKTSKNGDTPGPLFSRTDVVSRTAIIEPAVGYEVFARDTAAIDVYAGARIWVAETELKLTTAIGTQTRTFSRSRAWADPIVGARLR
jgi:hypothetical protein